MHLSHLLFVTSTVTNRGKKERQLHLQHGNRGIFLHGLENLGDGLPGQHLLECLLRLIKVGRQRALNVPPDQAIRVGLAMMHRQKLALINGPIDFQQRHAGGLPQQSPASSYARLRGDKAGTVEQAQHATDEHGVGVDAARDKLRCHNFIVPLRQQGQDMNCDSKLTVRRNSCFSPFIYL